MSEQKRKFLSPLELFRNAIRGMRGESALEEDLNIEVVVKGAPMTEEMLRQYVCHRRNQDFEPECGAGKADLPYLTHIEWECVTCPKCLALRHVN